jgi:hypothetical protein
MRPSRALPRRPITTDELTLARALWSPTVRYPAGSADQKWVRNTCGAIVMGAAGQTLFIHERCSRLIACLPDLVHDEHRPEDVLKVDADEDGKGGDDPYDGFRYAVMARTRKAGAPAVGGSRPVLIGHR